ncbi:latent-transforming growth factor beta-binding protein 4-like [Bradysia coprophila]|uniref:latent-transforming growth factor beta-binding protein 4-like n=1 Tax=Bradysia coprophila TaxID=38358 RepID=UPI00187D77EF|nr:latent-transforming growth factor beta-binding protein 4-like [Bradysia coprophila]
MKNLIRLSVAIILATFGNTANAFTCTVTGLFANTDSNDCKTFVSCGYSLQPEVHSCPENTFFWPAKQGCFSQYNCATNSMPSNTNPCEGNNYYSIPDPSSSDCSKYIQCNRGYVYNNGISFPYPQVTSVQCDSGTAFRPDTGCVSGYVCANYPCTSEGYFPNSNSVDCTTFIECWKRDLWLNNGQVTTLHSNVVTCPANSKFNPQLDKCDSFYNCDGNDPHAGTDPCGQVNWDNTIVANPFDSTQSSYISCRYSDSVGYYSGGFVYRNGILKEQCPAQTFFSSLLGKCYSAHVPNENCSKDPCSSGPGKYVNYPSGGCQTFIECRDDTTDRILYEPTYEIRYCPPGTLFSPTTGKATGKCISGYSCPSFPANYCYPAIATTTTSTTTTSAPA